MSTSPFYHPILPLLCDTEVYAQNASGRASAEPPVCSAPKTHWRNSSRPLAWRAAVRTSTSWTVAVGRLGVGRDGAAGREGWLLMATDELILAKSSGVGFGRDGYGNVDNPHLLYRPYIVEGRRRQRSGGFPRITRSDLIGFGLRRLGRRTRG